MLYRRKPVLAVQWFDMADHKAVTAIPAEVLVPAMLNGCFTAQRGFHPDVCGYINTASGGRIVFPGDWIITGSRCTYEVVSKDLFEEMYEPVSLNFLNKAKLRSSVSLLTVAILLCAIGMTVMQIAMKIGVSTKIISIVYFVSIVIFFSGLVNLFAILQVVFPGEKHAWNVLKRNYNNKSV